MYESHNRKAAWEGVSRTETQSLSRYSEKIGEGPKRGFHGGSQLWWRCCIPIFQIHCHCNYAVVYTVKLIHNCLYDSQLFTQSNRFTSIFLFFLYPPNHKSEKKSPKSTNEKKFWPHGPSYSVSPLFTRKILKSAKKLSKLQHKTEFTKKKTILSASLLTKSK